MFRPLLGSVLLFAAANLVSNVSAAVLYDEATAGDFSGSGLTPTSVGLLAPGSNQIFGSTGNVGGSDRDYFTLTVPNGYQLASILELPGTQSGNLSFIGLQEGPQVTLPTNTTTAAGLLGWWHYSPVDIGTNLLNRMSVPSQGSFGFSTPLHPGTYTLWVQDTSPGTFAYRFDLQVIPEPATVALMLLGIAACAIARRSVGVSIARA